MELICKWGCDGSSGHNEYMQKPTESYSDEDTTSDGNLFLFSLVPLQLNAYLKDEEVGVKKCIWKNPTPSSTRYCRPIKFKYLKETSENIRLEVSAVDNEIKDLHPISMKTETESNTDISLSYTPVFTMVDGKVINALTSSSSQSCFICKCKPSDMNKLDTINKFTVQAENLKYGLSSLHAWIRCFECLLHVGYRLKDSNKLGRLTSSEKEAVANRKLEIQKRFWKEMGLKVDKVIQGMGTSNTGNVARRFFANAEKSAGIIGVDVNLIKRFSTILSVISSGHEINADAFDDYALNTAKLFVRLYEWYRMPPTVHKILVHGALIIKNAILPIGVFSEEAQESKNKEYKRIREHHTRKSARILTNTDITNNLLVSSDPKITSLSILPKCNKKLLSPEANQLLIVTEDEINSEDSD